MPLGVGRVASGCFGFGAVGSAGLYHASSIASRDSRDDPCDAPPPIAFARHAALVSGGVVGGVVLYKLGRAFNFQAHCWPDVPSSIIADAGQRAAMKRIIAMATQSDVAVVTTGYRGMRKTTNAKQAARDSLWNPFLCVMYIDGKGSGEFEGAVRIKDVVDHATTVITFLSPAVYGAASLLQVATYVPAFWTGFMASALWETFFRKHVWIVDDLVRGSKADGGDQDITSLRRHLQRVEIHCSRNKFKLILMSSNEGLEQVFEDRSGGVHVFDDLPEPSDETVADVLRATIIQDAAGNDAINATADEMARNALVQANTLNMPHWSKSARFYRVLQQRGFLKTFAETGKLHEETSQHRLRLLVLANLLDLDTDVITRPVSLGASKALSQVQKQSLMQLVGAKNPAKMAEEMPAVCPRRYGLLWALVLTAPDHGDGPAIYREVKAGIAHYPEPTRLFERGVAMYEEHMVPLQEKLKKLDHRDGSAISPEVESDNARDPEPTPVFSHGLTMYEKLMVPLQEKLQALVRGAKSASAYPAASKTTRRR